jgi:hypothetical protein
MCSSKPIIVYIYVHTITNNGWKEVWALYPYTRIKRSPKCGWLASRSSFRHLKNWLKVKEQYTPSSQVVLKSLMIMIRSRIGDPLPLTHGGQIMVRRLLFWWVWPRNWFSHEVVGDWMGQLEESGGSKDTVARMGRERGGKPWPPGW